ncbi:uncharacterized protein LOC120636037 [Pararge aegeria]|uniref:uncharacterized protein LOC120636037 n=1 Tax=Pararge aegeria TaxID=116150 RepID=UPI0019D20DC3|nr:uncharacterized protein LOC120636037 [Pararge aegeria]XP_039763237.1 uncharacterized protein LOC120636037 [Pararge aegeria]XP_039763246.1 uncharacterized protein LOC120636037 [Pararge aegeria]
MLVRPLSPALAEKARIELSEDPKRLEENIRHLKQWISKQPHLRARTDEQWLAAFLRGCKHRLEQTKAKIDLYYSFRSKAPYLYSIKYNEPKFMDIMNLGAVLILPKTHKPADPRVILYRIGQYDTKEYSAIEVMAVLGLLEQICFMEDDNLVVSGTVNVIDLAGTRWTHFTQTPIRQLKNLIQANQDAMPIRIKSVHFLNAPLVFSTFFNICKRFLSEKTKSRIMVHSKSNEALHQFVPKEILPQEYGGTGDSIQQSIAYWKEKVRKYNSFLEEDLKYGCDESKRPAKTQQITTVEEPFRRLEPISMIRELNPKLAEIAKIELNENPTHVENDLRHLKEWLAKQLHLKARTDDQWLIAILRGCKFSLERAKTKLDLFYTLRTTAPEVTLRLKPTEAEFMDFLRLGTCVILRQPKDALHPCVILIRAGEYDPQKHNVADIMCALYYLVQILVIENDTATVMGTMIVVDYEKVTLSHLTQASPSLLKKLVAVSQDSLPLRLKGSHHVNVPAGIEIIFKLVSGFLGEKARKRLRIYKSNEELLKNLPKEVIPVEYGGSGGTISELIDYWANKIQEYKPWLEEEMQFGTDESKRITKVKNNSNQGSFRKLDID